MAVVDMAYTIRSLASDGVVEASEDTPPITLGDFECRLSGTAMTVAPTQAFDSIEAARAELEPHLKDWEAEFDLQGLPIRFEFSSFHERDEVQAGQPQQHHVSVSATVGISVSAWAKATVQFSAPKGEYRSTPVVDYLRYRWLSAVKTYYELPTSAAYALLSFLEHSYGGRKGVAQRLNVADKVLDTAGRLASQADPLQGRKLKGQAKPLTPEGIGWLNTFIVVVGKRAAYVESGNTPAGQLGLNDPSFPQLGTI